MERYMVRVQLDSSAREALGQICDRTGMTQVSVMSRVVSWLARQNEVVQARVLGSFSEETAAEFARQLLEDMAQGKGVKAGVEGEEKKRKKSPR